MQFHTIKDVLVFWRESHSAMPLTWFAKRAGVSSSTLQRIFDGTTKLPDFATGRSICLNALNSQIDAIDILKTLYPDKVNYLTEESKSLKEVEKFSNHEVLNAYKDYYKWQLLCLSYISPVPLKKLEEVGGQVYLKKAQELVKDGLLVNKDDQLTYSVSSGYVINGRILVDAIGYIARSLRDKLEREDVDQDGYVFLGVEGFSVEGKAEVRRALAECAEKIEKIKQIKSNLGNLPASFMMTLSDLI